MSLVGFKGQNHPQQPAGTDSVYEGLRKSLRLHLELYGKECERDCWHSACWAIKGLRRRLALAEREARDA